ncbi:TIGR04255 family protein [Candidatus Poriferisodalis sp.]|uniref:TIGR04255 family protein n=1 Tax=Candidatus Poriferisodalis sp. TaxID=3101277 RepID=UPI003B02ABC0
MPFGESVERVHLDRDPLVRVVAQVRFAPILSVREQSFVAPFQEAIRHAYPLVEKETQQEVALGASGALQMSDSALWRFWGVERNWQVTLAENFVSLACSDYSDRDDFLSRLADALNAVREHIRPGHISRVGVRYVDRLSGHEMLDRLPEFVRPELLGLSNAELGEGVTVRGMMQAEFSIHEVRLSGKWGHLPPGMTHDLSLDALDELSWILDLDAFTEVAEPFDSEACEAKAGRYADIVYGFFRWAVSDEFLVAHGAEQ